MAEYWANGDGLVVRFGKYAGETHNMAAQPSTAGKTQELVVDIVGASIHTTDLPTQFIQSAKIPANSLVLSATLITNAAFAGVNAVMDIGTYDSTGTAVDDDGIDAAIATASLGADVAIACDGAVIGTVVTADTWIGATYDTAAFTAGKAVLIVRYIKQEQ